MNLRKLTNSMIRGIKGPFMSKPVSNEGSYSYSHLNKDANKYHKKFNDEASRSIIWNIEKDLIDNISSKYGPFDIHLDFAGGTGRIAGLLEEQCNDQYILDISEKMLSVARKDLKNIKIICRDFRKGVSELQENNIDLVTAFRFFPNAEVELRESAMNFIASKVKNGGLLMCNNHINFWSVPVFFKRLFFLGGLAGMSNKEMIELASDNGFILIKTYSMGVFPQTGRKAFVSWRFVKWFEKLMFNRFGTKHRIGQNVVFVFKQI